MLRQRSVVGARTFLGPHGRNQAGLSLVEMLVGIALGLFIVAAAATLGATQLSENRRLLLETQVQQDLRATMDIITREIRRAGAPVDVLPTLWLPDAPNTMPIANAFAGPTVVSGDVISYRYSRTEARSDDLGFTFAGNTISSRVGNESPQPLTDRNTLKVTAFSVTEQATPTLQLACERLCPDGTQACWPTLKAREYLVTVTGESPTDSTVRRTMVSRVRIRNDALQFNAAGAVCPS